jgi:hypothetical protein
MNPKWFLQQTSLWVFIEDSACNDQAAKEHASYAKHADASAG